MKNKPKNIPSPYKFAGTKIFRDTTALPFLTGGPLVDKTNHGKLLNSVYASALGNYYANGGQFLTAGGEYHKIYKNANGDIIVNHPKENKGKWDTINLTDKANAKTIADGIAATKKWHAENPNVYAAGGQMQSQGCSPGYYWNGKECVKSFVPVAKETPKPVVKNKKEQELLNYGKKTLPNKKSVDKSVKNIPFYGDISNAAQPDDLQENITEFVDPSGYFSWDDAYRAKAAWDKSGSEYPSANQALDIFGAVPGLGKLGKLKYLKNASAIKNSMKYVAPAFGVIPWQSILNAFDTGQDVNQDNINYTAGGMLKRADGSYSQRGLWDNIRANKGSGKKPTKEMLAQERKINREYRTGGQFPRPYSLPEDSFKQGGTNLHNSIYASSNAQYPAIYAEGGELESGCPPGSYWNGKSCVKLPKGAFVTSDPDEYEFRKAAYDDSLYSYNKSNKPFKTILAEYVDEEGANAVKHKPIKSKIISSYDKNLIHYSSSPARTKYYEKTGKVLPPNRSYKTDIKTSYYPTTDILGIGVTMPWEKYSTEKQWKPRFKKPVQPVIFLDKNEPKQSITAKKSLPSKSNKPYPLLDPRTKQYATTRPEVKSNPKQEISPISQPVIKENIVIDKLPIKPTYIDRPRGILATQTNTTPEEVIEETNVNYAPEYIEEGGSDSTGYHVEDRTKRYIDWNGRAVGYRPLKFRKPGHSGDLIKLGGKKYFYLPTIEKRTEAWLEPNENIEGQEQGYRNGGMMSHFYASNVPDNNISNKDLTYPENSYVYAQGGNLNSLPMNRYPAASRFLQKGSTASPLTNMMSLPAKTVAYEKGGKIYIKPENRGKFTASANRAGMGVQEFASHVLANKEDYSSTQVKRANFAHNAAGWKHKLGGNLNISTIPNVQTTFNTQPIMNFKYGGFNNPGFNALPKNVQAKIKARTFNNGGVMPQLTEFNEGGRHEENPLGGIPQGTAADGRLNLVEEGETKLDAANYIFSDTLKLDEGVAAAFNLPKKDVGKTFAEISKKLNRPNSRRDNDTIEQNAIARDLENLMLAQEAFKQIDLQKDIEMMKTKHPELMEAMDAAMQQQSAQEQGPAPEEMAQAQGAPQGAPQPGSPEEQAMMEQQMMQEQMMAQQQGGMPQGQPMSPEEMAQIPMSYGGAMFMRGGKMCYANGGHMYGKGGQVLRSIGAGAYGVGEGLLDTLTFGLTDQITDKGYDALAGIGDRDKEDLERDKMIRGFGNTAGAIGGAVVNPASLGSAISEGSEGLGAGLTNIKGTNAEFDKTVNSLAQIGSMAGGLVGGGNPAGGLKGAEAGIDAADAATQQASQMPQFAETLMKAGQNPFLQQVTGMAGSMMQRNGGRIYPSMYKYGGSFEMPRQQMYMPLDNVERAGGYLFAGGGMMDPPDNPNNPIPLTDVPRININGKLYTMEEALAASASGEIKSTPEDINDYFPSANPVSNNEDYEGSLEEDDTDETNIQTQDEEDLANLSFPGANNPNIITGGKGDYSDMEDLNEEILAADNMVSNAKNPKDKKDAQEYLSALKRMKTELENKNVDLSMKQTPMQAAGLAAPIAYNLGMGLFSKPTQLKAEDYLNKSRVSPYKVNVDPQLNEARLAYNAAEQGIRNASPNAGAYLTNRANIAKMRAGSLGEILAKKENVDAQLQMQADAQNAQLEAQNRGTKFAIDDWNAKSKEAKRKYLEKSIEQMGTLSQNAQAMDVQEKYMRLLSPQYGKTFEYQTIFDQLKDYYKNKKSSKENKA